MFCDRKELYKAIEKERNSKLIVYVTGTRPGLETQIANDILPMFVEHLDRIGDMNLISYKMKTQQFLGSSYAAAITSTSSSYTSKVFVETSAKKNTVSEYVKNRTIEVQAKPIGSQKMK